MGLRDLERRRLPGEYDLDLDLDLDRERLLEERDRLRLLDLEREDERDRDREREEEREDLEDRELERDEERPRLLDRLRDLEGPLFLFSWPLRRRARILARKNSYRPFCSQPSLHDMVPMRGLGQPPRATVASSLH